MSNFYLGPHKVVYGNGKSKDFGIHIRDLGDTVTILTDSVVYPLINDFLKSLIDNGVKYQIRFFHGECSYDYISLLEKIIKKNASQVIIGIGGGKIQDTVKYVGYLSNIKIVTVPSSASNCASWSSHSAIYKASGEALEYAPIYKNPDLLYIDEAFLLSAPERFFIAGIGDSLAKWVETKTFASKYKELVAESELETALYLSKKVYDDILNFGVEALNDYRSKNLTPKLSKIFKHIIINSGLIGGIGGEYVGATASHSINNGFTVFPDVNKNNLHGETVAFGNLVQLQLDGASDDEIQQLIKLHHEIGLPSNLKDLGFTLTQAQLNKIVDKTLDSHETIWNLSYEVGKKQLFDAIVLTNDLGYKHIEKIG